MSELKHLLKTNHVTAKAVFEDLTAHEVYCSHTGIKDWISKNRWPTRVDPLELRKSINRLLKNNHKEEVANVFDSAPDVYSPAYSVLELIKKYELVQADLVRAVNASGIKISAATISQILNKGQWPKTIDQVRIQAAISDWLQPHISKAECNGLWQVAAARVSNKPEDSTIDELWEVEMLNPSTMRHFKLKRHPFQNEVNSESDLFMSQQQIDVREAMVQATLNGSILAVIGEVGAGKTEIRKGYIEYMRRNHPEAILIEPTVINKKKLTAEMIFDAIAEELGVLSLPRGLEQRARKVERAMRQSVKADNLHVLIIEEAHDLSNDVIKYLKRIWELSDGFKRLISIVLVGQSELNMRLSTANHEVREFSNRCQIAQLYPLSAEINQYIAHKFKRIGTNYLEVIDDDAIFAMQQRLQGAKSWGSAKSNANRDMTYPLYVNNFLVKAMNFAAQLQEPKVTAEIIKELK